jgi:hypothetical protein
MNEIGAPEFERHQGWYSAMDPNPGSGMHRFFNLVLVSEMK